MREGARRLYVEVHGGLRGGVRRFMRRCAEGDGGDIKSVFYAESACARRCTEVYAEVCAEVFQS